MNTLLPSCSKTLITKFVISRSKFLILSMNTNQMVSYLNYLCLSVNFDKDAVVPAVGVAVNLIPGIIGKVFRNYFLFILYRKKKNIFETPCK